MLRAPGGGGGSARRLSHTARGAPQTPAPPRAPLPPASVGVVDPADLKEGDPWTMEELEDIRDECFAADVDIDFDKLSIMSRERVEQYFVDGS